MMPRTVYLDYAATTPLDPTVLETMLPFFSDAFGNASSVHQAGQRARRAIDQARDQIATAIACDASDLYFTSGGTEADNTALLGVLLAARDEGRDHLVTTTIEHHAVLDCARFAERELGFCVTYVPVDSEGLVDPDAVVAAVTDRTVLVSVMRGNNEVGTIQPIREISERLAGRAFLHTDAVQSFGLLDDTVESLGVDLMTLSAHKIYGPKGAGALYVRNGVPFRPWLYGGMQEREKRAGTENAAAIVGFGEAAEQMVARRTADAVHLTDLRDRFFQTLAERIPGVVRNGHSTQRLPNNVNISFPDISGETLLLALDMYGIAASSGSACASGSIEPSHVLLALDRTLAEAKTAVRFSLGRQTTWEDLQYVVDTLADSVLPSARV